MELPHCEKIWQQQQPSLPPPSLASGAAAVAVALLFGPMGLFCDNVTLLGTGNRTASYFWSTLAKICKSVKASLPDSRIGWLKHFPIQALSDSVTTLEQAPNSHKTQLGYTKNGN